VSLEIVFLVLLAGLVHAIWNAMVKGILESIHQFRVDELGDGVRELDCAPVHRTAAWRGVPRPKSGRTLYSPRYETVLMVQIIDTHILRAQRNKLK